MMKSKKGYTLSIKELYSYDIPFSAKIKPVGVYSYMCRKDGDSYRRIAENIEGSIVAVFVSANLYKVKCLIMRKDRRKKRLGIRQ